MSAKFILISLLLAVTCASVGTELAFARNVAMGARYTFEPQALYPYTRDQSDGTKLTDGELSSGRFWTSRKGTVGWQGSKTIQIEIDLGKRHEIHQVCVNTARGMNSGVSFPARVDVFVSQDHEHYTYSGNVMHGADRSDGPYQVKKFCSNARSANGRYVWLFIVPRGPYTFTDEIEVAGDLTRESSQSPYALKRARIATFQESLAHTAHRIEALRSQAVKLAQAYKISNVAQSDAHTAIEKVIEALDRSEAAQDNPSLEDLETKLRGVNGQVLQRYSDLSLLPWHHDPWARFSKYNQPFEGKPYTGPIEFDLMRGGAASDAIALTNVRGEGLQFHLEINMSGAAPIAPTIQIREAVEITTAQAEVFSDPLVSLQNALITILPGSSKQIWLTVLAGNAKPGTYHATLIASEAMKKSPAYSIPLIIRIWTAELPQHQSLMVTNWSYLTWRPIAKLAKQAVQDLKDHHTNVLIIHPSQIPWPKFQLGNSELFEIDFAAFDKAIDSLMGAERILFFLNFGEHGLRTFSGRYPFLSEEWKRVYTNWITAWTHHLAQRNIGTEKFVFYPIDEPKSPEDATYVYETSRLIKAINPHFQTYTTIGKLGALDLLRLTEVVDIFQVHLPELLGGKPLSLMTQARQLWSYTAEGGGKSADPLGFYRTHAWKAFKVGATGIGFWAYADTGPAGTAWNDIDGTRPDYSVIYEGDNSIITSKRWEAWREGIEDYELLVQAKRKIRNNDEKAAFERMVDEIIQLQGDYQKLKLTRRWMLEVASR